MLKLLLVLTLALSATLSATAGFGQDEAPRQLWDSQFLKKRTPPKSPSAVPRKSTGYRRATPKAEAIEETANGEVVGLTIWRLRQARDADNKEARLLLQEEPGGEAAEFTPERVESETPFAAGDRVRLSIESPRDGYLYVIDREQYADGTLSDPYLIFPTMRNRNGDNAVKAGKVIELPGRSAFRLTPMRPDYQGEVLTLIVSATPLTEIKPGPGILKLDRALLEVWEQKWRAPIERFELNGGAGTPYTKAEKEAGEDGSRLLTQEDELPQTLFRVGPKPGNALLIPVSLKIVRKP
ncbi:MAG: DUF4384 domain-containing protein [Acidobacteriota bacterium]